MEKSLTGKEKILDDYWELVDEYGDHPKNCLKYLHNKPDECDCEQYDVLKDLILKYGEEKYQDGVKYTDEKYGDYAERMNKALLDAEKEAIETFKKELVEKIKNVAKNSYVITIEDLNELINL